MKFKRFIMPLLITLVFMLQITAEMVPVERQLPLLVDDAGLLNRDEYNSLLAILNEISERNSCEVAVVTVNSLDGKSIQSFADDFYDYNGYGWGTNDDGIMLVISIQDRDWYITTYGFGIKAVTDYDIEVVAEKITGKLSVGRYYDAFVTFAEYCDECINYARNSAREDFYSLIIISIAIGFIIALITVSVMKAQLKSVRKNESASLYTVPGSMRITDSRDIYLYRTVKRIAKPKEGSGRGGSSTHTSSSGRTHGGGGGKF
jgi:uncharacterized protein